MRKIEIGWRDEDEEGNRIEMMAVRGPAGYRFKFWRKGDEEWTWIDRPTLTHAEKLLEIIDLRHRRRRASYKEVQVAQKLVDDMKARG